MVLKILFNSCIGTYNTSLMNKLVSPTTIVTQSNLGFYVFFYILNLTAVYPLIYINTNTYIIVILGFVNFSATRSDTENSVWWNFISATVGSGFGVTVNKLVNKVIFAASNTRVYLNKMIWSNVLFIADNF